MRTRFLLAALLAWAALPASAQEREWIFDTGDEDAYLVFGVPDSAARCNPAKSASLCRKRAII